MRAGSALFLAGLATLVASCALGPDAEQARICRRALPALDPGARITVLRIAPDPEPSTIRIVYEARREGRPPLERFARCRFAADGLAGNKASLVGLATEEGPISGAALYLLKRYYLDTPDALASDPGVGVAADVPEISAPLAYALQQALVAMPKAAIYGLLAAAYALVFGLVQRINFAFGEIAAIGGAATLAGVAGMLALGSASPLAGLTLGLAAAGFAGALYGLVGGLVTIASIPGPSTQPSLIASVGLSLALMEFLRLTQSAVTVWLAPVFAQVIPVARARDFIVVLTPVSVITTGLGLAVATGLVVLMRATSFGRAWRASAEDPLAAALVGVDGVRILRRTLALSGALAGLSGLLIVVHYGGLGFAGGFAFGFKALIAAVLGGIGSVPGALVGGLAIGAFEAIWSAALPIEARDIALYAGLVAVLVLRPGGFSGEGDRTPRRV